MLNPGTPIDAIDNVIDLVDLVLIMTVNPGFGGQSFIASQLEEDRSRREAHREIRPRTSRWKSMAASRRRRRSMAISAGANVLVAGHRRVQRRPGTLRRQHRRACAADARGRERAKAARPALQPPTGNSAARSGGG